MKWLEEVLQAYQENPRPLKLKEIYEYVENNSTRVLPVSYQAIIRRTIESFSTDSDSFLGQADIFHSSFGKGKGIWELRNIQQTPIAPDTSDPQLPDRSRVEVTRIIRDTLLAHQLKNLYQNKCQICGKKIRLLNQDYSEAHHIRPLGDPHRGIDEWSNILILCPNHHVEYDYGAIAIDPPTKRIIHIDPNNDFSGMNIRINEEHILNDEFLTYHLETIFNH